MIDTRLLKLVRGSGKYIIATAFLQWIQLLSNIVIMSLVAWLLCSFMTGDITHEGSFLFLGGVIAAVVVRALCTMGASKMSYLASSTVKHVLRTKIMEKMLRMGGNYKESVPTSEVVQLSTEGVEQLETYFSSYLPQLIYALAAPLTLFIFLSQYSFSSAFILFICVPLIPMTIIRLRFLISIIPYFEIEIVSPLCPSSACIWLSLYLTHDPSIAASELSLT